MTLRDPVDLAVGLETAVWQALVDGDPRADEALLAEDFVGVYPTGPSDRAGHAGQLVDGPTVSDYSILHPSVLEIAADCLLLTYEAHYRRGPERSLERMFVSSLWANRDGRWVNLFSQDTPRLDHT